QTSGRFHYTGDRFSQSECLAIDSQGAQFSVCNVSRQIETAHLVLLSLHTDLGVEARINGCSSLSHLHVVVVEYG
ncbi:hypothetical protein PFISCL1PPCAC_22760, partial [Pristionchus fissidentatus]